MHGLAVRPIGFLFVLLTLPVLQASDCSKSSTGPNASSNYTLNWVFVNASTLPEDANLDFVGIDTSTSASIRRTVAGNGGAASGQTVGPFSNRELGVRVNVEPRDSDFRTIIVVPDEATTITVVWDGRNIEVTTSAGSAPTWVLSAPREAGGNWADQFGSATGSLRFDALPLTVQEGQTYRVIASFAATVTHAPGFFRNVDLSVGIIDRGAVPLFQVIQTQGLGQAAPTVSGALSAAGDWVIQANRATLAIEAGGNVLQGGPAGSGLTLVATYRKVQ
jgi:hypothetical protein